MFNYFSLSDIEEYTTTLNEPELKLKLRASKSLDGNYLLTVRDEFTENTSIKFITLNDEQRKTLNTLLRLIIVNLNNPLKTA